MLEKLEQQQNELTTRLLKIRENLIQQGLLAGYTREEIESKLNQMRIKNE